MMWFTPLTLPLLMELRDAAPGWEHWASIEHAAALCAGGSALMEQLDGEPPRVVLAGGVADVWKGRGLGWALIRPGTPRRQIVFAVRYARTRLAKLLDGKLLDGAGYRRIEISVIADYAAGHVLAEGLGFTAECVARRYGPDGRDHVLYSRVTP